MDVQLLLDVRKCRCYIKVVASIKQSIDKLFSMWETRESGWFRKLFSNRNKRLKEGLGYLWVQYSTTTYVL